MNSKSACFFTRAAVTICLTWAIAWQLSAQPTSTRPTIGLQENEPTTFAIRGASIWIAPAKKIENATIVLRNGLIERVGVDVPVPVEAQTIDATGKTVYAGFINGFTEREVKSTSGAAGYWNPNVTPERNALEGLTEAHHETYREQGFVARLVAPKSGQIKGTSGLVLCGDEPSNLLIVQQHVALHLSLTARRSRESYPSSPMGAVALVRQAFYDADWYDKAWRAVRANPRLPHPETNQALETLVDWRNRGAAVIIDTSNERYFSRADRLAREFSLPLIVRGSGREYRRLEDVVDTGRPIILPLNFPKAPAVSTTADAAAASLASLMHWDLAPENPARLVAAGAKIAFTTEGLDKVSDFWQALRSAVERGLPEDEALAALTTIPASLFSVDEQLGTLESGKAAHLVLASGNLFTEAKAEIEETWIAGKRFRIAKEEDSNLSGKWQLEFREGGPDKPLVLNLGQRLTRKSAWLIHDDRRIKLTHAERQGPRISLVFEGAPLDRAGFVTLALVAVGEAQPGATMTGSGTWPDGSTFHCTATKTEDPPDKAADDPDGDEGEEEEPERGDDQPDDEPSSDKIETSPPDAPAEVDQLPEETPEPDAEDVGDQPGDDEPGDEEPGDEEVTGSESQNQEDQDPQDQEKEDQDEDEQEAEPATGPASFDVNYPLGAYGGEGFPDRPETVAFTGATVWTCGPAGKLEGATVLIRDGKITAMGRDLEIPEDATLVEASGKHLTPGIIDCHSHIATDGGVNEGTQAITAEVRIGDFIDADDIAIYRQLAGGVTAANILHGSANPVGGQNQVIKMRWGANSEELKFAAAPAGIKFALGENVKQSNWGDDHKTRYPQTRMGVDEIHIDAFQRAIAYRQSWERWKRQSIGLPPRVDLELEALAEIIAGQRWIHCHSYRQSEIMALMQTCDRFGITIGTFQHILEGYKVADEMARRGIMGSAFSDWWAYKFEVYDAIPFAGALMHNAGVVVSFNSDDAEMGRRLNAEAAKAMRYGGVSELEALKFVTLNPARQLRIDNLVGSIEPGKDADLVLWNAPPLSIYAICQQTWVDGRLMFDAEADRQLRQRDQTRHAALVQKILKSDAPQRKSGEDDKNQDDLWARYDTFCHPHQHHDE